MLNDVRSQAGNPVAVGGPGAGGLGGDAPIVVEVYALGVGVSHVGECGNLPRTEGSFELEANGKIFVFDPLSAHKANGFISSVEGYISPIFQSVQAVDEENLSHLRAGNTHPDSPLKTCILALPQGYGKTTMGPQLAERLGCSQIIDEWSFDQPLTPGALHLTNDLSALQVPA